MTPQERIKADAEAYVQRTRGQQGRVETYIAGATAEHDRAQVLVDALEEFIRADDELTEAINNGVRNVGHLSSKSNDLLEGLKEALEQWKGGKEVEDA